MKITRHLAGVVAGMVLGAGALGAQSLEFKGTTEACFLSTHLNAPDCPTMSSLAFDQSVVFAGGSFDQWSTNTNPGSLAIGDAAHPNSNFGYLNLYALPSEYYGDVFKLAINFYDPTHVSPAAVFTATMYGQVDWFGNGGAYIHFAQPQTFSFDGPTYAGSFTLALNDIGLSPSGLTDPYTAITGNINTNISGPVTATPEPGTTALLATGIIGLIPMIRRRNKKAQNA